MIGKKLTRDRFAYWLSQQPCPRHIGEIILHHTWRPTAAQYRGEATIKAIHRVHTQTNGWSDIGYHFLVAPNGDIWAGRPLARAGAHTKGRNAHSIGVCLIGNFDEEELGTAQRRAAVVVLRACLDRFKLHSEALNFHRDYAPKSCPGALLDKAQWRAWVSQGLSPPEEEEGDDAEEHPDVPAWAREAMEWCVEQGLIKGMPDGSLQGYRPVTRAELALVLRRFYDLLAGES